MCVCQLVFSHELLNKKIQFATVWFLIFFHFLLTNFIVPMIESFVPPKIWTTVTCRWPSAWSWYELKWCLKHLHVCIVSISTGYCWDPALTLIYKIGLYITTKADEEQFEIFTMYRLALKYKVHIKSNKDRYEEGFDAAVLSQHISHTTSKIKFASKTYELEWKQMICWFCFESHIRHSLASVSTFPLMQN